MDWRCVMSSTIRYFTLMNITVIGPYLGVYRCRYRLDYWQICHPTQNCQRLKSRRLYPWSRTGRSHCLCVDVYSDVSSQLFCWVLDRRFEGPTLGVRFEKILLLRDCRFAALLDRHIPRQISLPPILPLSIWGVQDFHARLVVSVCVHSGCLPGQLHFHILGLRSSSLFIRFRWANDYWEPSHAVI